MNKISLLQNISIFTTTFGLAIILIWIGLFKFTPTEAQGIVGLIKPSPLLSWMYNLFSVTTTSRIIGVFEIVTALLLVAGLLLPKAGIAGSVLAIIIFFTTCTFLVTSAGVFAKIDGMWVPSDLGSFLIKDIVSLGASVYLLSNYLQKIT